MLCIVWKASIARIFLRLMSFSVSSRLPSNLHFFHFSLPCRIISYSSVLDSLITRLRFARVDGVVSLIYVILCLAVVAQVISQFRPTNMQTLSRHRSPSSTVVPPPTSNGSRQSSKDAATRRYSTRHVAMGVWRHEISLRKVSRDKKNYLHALVLLKIGSTTNVGSKPNVM